MDIQGGSNMHAIQSGTASGPAAAMAAGADPLTRALPLSRVGITGTLALLTGAGS
jgi:hypothetical protein